ncbi:unnamed protein product [Protopolystoma xenopodis]|uniref:Uncharacterized protein n=1 Tax=Protopolystoma xenopodis TaxID=117903 RepID=A0A3S5AW52_9PLAT|nr:unnamed protein product [Protopolystoma xenopodis]
MPFMMSPLAAGTMVQGISLTWPSTIEYLNLDELLNAVPLKAESCISTLSLHFRLRLLQLLPFQSLRISTIPTSPLLPRLHQPLSNHLLQRRVTQLLMYLALLPHHPQTLLRQRPFISPRHIIIKDIR